jgi:hypothetical protein
MEGKEESWRRKLGTCMVYGASRLLRLLAWARDVWLEALSSCLGLPLTIDDLLHPSFPDKSFHDDLIEDLGFFRWLSNARRVQQSPELRDLPTNEDNVR